MDKEILKSIILALVPIIGFVISAYILPSLKNFIETKCDKEEIESINKILDSMICFINKMVKAMEQEHPEWQGEDKKSKVLDTTVEYLSTYFGLDVDSEDIEFISEIIEGIVKEVKYPTIS